MTTAVTRVEQAQPSPRQRSSTPGVALWYIITHLVDGGDGSTAAIAKAFGINSAAASQACCRLIEIQWATRIATGVYAPTDRARAMVREARDRLRRSKIASLKREKDRIARTHRTSGADDDDGAVLRERHQHDVIVFERRAITDEKGQVVDQAYGPRVTTQTMIDRYLQRSSIDKPQWLAGNRFRSLWHRSGLTPRLVINLESGGISGSNPWRGLPSTAAQVEARIMLHKAMTELGRLLTSVLVDVVCYDMAASEWAIRRRRPPTDGIGVLRAALDACDGVELSSARRHSHRA